jgi:hypothetical protein
VKNQIIRKGSIFNSRNFKIGRGERNYKVSFLTRDKLKPTSPHDYNLIMSGINDNDKRTIRKKFCLNKNGVKAVVEKACNQIGYGIATIMQAGKNIIISVYKKLLGS